MTSINESDIKKGQAIYTPIMLKLYDLWVLDISNTWIWRCSKSILQEQFNQCATANHLDIGVGTGFYLKQYQWPLKAQLSLMDLNPNCLEVAKNISQNIMPNVYLHDIFKPNQRLFQQFNSVSINYLLHCLPGSMATKSVAIANAVSMLMPGGVLFGATILVNTNLHTKMSKRLCAFYNKKGIFSNENDTLDALKVTLEQHLTDVDIKVVGCVALFKGKRIPIVSE
ncbi:MAG: methyltransferase type 12 [Legionella sp.]|nr:MAG: methyltransferase type 12 [Legionella sp.]